MARHHSPLIPLDLMCLLSVARRLCYSVGRAAGVQAPEGLLRRGRLDLPSLLSHCPPPVRGSRDAGLSRTVSGDLGLAGLLVSALQQLWGKGGLRGPCRGAKPSIWSYMWLQGSPKPSYMAPCPPGPWSDVRAGSCGVLTQRIALHPRSYGDALVAP